MDPSRTVLIIVDMENDFVKPGASFEVQAGVSVIYTTHAHRPDGSEAGHFADIYIRPLPKAEC